jgi:hypothetical protein
MKEKVKTLDWRNKLKMKIRKIPRNLRIGSPCSKSKNYNLTIIKLLNPLLS